MGRNIVIIRHFLISTICIVLLLWGCERSTAVPAKPLVVRKKIAAQKADIAKAHEKKTVRTTDRMETAKSPQKVTPVMAETTPIVPKMQSTEIVGKDKQPLIAKNVPVTPTQKVESKTLELKKAAIRPKSEISEIKRPLEIQKPVSDDLAVAGKELTTAEAEKGRTEEPNRLPATYDPIGKTDPFEPLFKEKPVPVRKKERKKRIPRTPLERIDLSQLKLVAIVLSSSGNMALMEEASGKGYVIKKGTYIGTNAGKVVQINKEKVIVEEEFEDAFGKVNTRQRDIKLPKPPGEF
jgi:type IV pilus assembly protein PilP